MQHDSNITSSPVHQYHCSCAKCNYDITSIDPTGRCPECGTPILSDCFWCKYSLDNIDPSSKCPECGVPVALSIGKSALNQVDTELLKSIHKGFRIVTQFILLYIITIIATFVGSILVGMSVNNNDLYLYSTIASIVNNGIVLIILFGWFKVSQHIPEFPKLIDVPQRRSFLRITLWVFIASTILLLLWSFVPTNPDINAPMTRMDIAGMFIIGFSFLVMIVLYVAQMLYLNWFAKLVRNKKMETRAIQLLWGGPIIAILGSMLLFLGPLIVLVLYWNLIEYLRRDIKKIIKARDDSSW